MCRERGCILRPRQGNTTTGGVANFHSGDITSLEETGQIVRIDRLPDGKSGFAIHILHHIKPEFTEAPDRSNANELIPCRLPAAGRSLFQHPGAPIANGLFDGITRRGQSDSRPYHHPAGFATECGGLEDLPFARMIGIASRLAPELHGKARDKLQDQAASGAVWLGSLSNRDLHFFKKLLPLRLRKTNDQPD